MHAEQEVKNEAGDVRRRMYLRHYPLPKGVDVEHIRPSMTNDGVLTIEAPAPSLAPTERLIPIEYKGGDAAASKLLAPLSCFGVNVKPSFHSLNWMCLAADIF